MSRRAYACFFLTFALGVLIGCVGTYMYGWYGGRWQSHRSPTPDRVASYLKRELNLSDAQAQQVRQIISDLRQKNAQVHQQEHQQMEPRFQANIEEARNRTRAILSPQQLEKFNAMVKRWDEQRKERHGARR
jgi:hypothetical protein